MLNTSTSKLRFQQVATEYEQIKNAGIDPQVSELAEYHGLGWTAARACGLPERARTQIASAPKMIVPRAPSMKK